MFTAKTLSLFQGYGVELEYMIVDSNSLSIRPIADEIIKSACGQYQTDFENGAISWANEMVMHVLEVRTENPAATLDGVHKKFQENVNHINHLASKFGACLMPGSMHPWMNPQNETVLWKREYGDVFAAFDSIFDCKKHGWGNIQSCQLNLPFSSDDEFGRLHAAIRLILPLLPALASSSPIVEGRLTHSLNNRLIHYQSDFHRVRSMTADCIPEPIFTQEHYRSHILAPLYKELESFSQGYHLQNEWANARGAIARFDRNAIEIRLMDMQECPKMDLALCRLVSNVIKSLVHEQWGSYKSLKEYPTQNLKTILDSITIEAEKVELNDPVYLRLFGFSGRKIRAGDLWEHLLDRIPRDPTEEARREYQRVRNVLKEGVLSSRIKRALQQDFSMDHIREIYRQLKDCLSKGKMFHAPT